MRDDRRRLHPLGTRRSVVAAVRRAAPASVPTVVGTLGAAAVVVTAAVVLGAGITPTPEQALPRPIVVDADPGLPSDEEPPEGWPPPRTMAGRAPIADSSVEAPTDDPTSIVDELTGTVDDTTSSLTGPLQDAIEDTTDTVGEVVDAVDADGVTDALDEAVDAVDEMTDTVSGLVDDPTGTTGTTTDRPTEPLQELP